jgi:hypothetical protein
MSAWFGNSLSQEGFKVRNSLVLVLISAAVSWAPCTAGQGFGAAIADFQQEHPEIGLYFGEDGRLARVWGGHFSNGATPLESAESFVAAHGQMLARGVGQLVAGRRDPDGSIEHPKMWQPDRNDYKFHLVHYDQMLDGIPVFRGMVRILTLNQAGHPAVLASVDLRDLEGAQIFAGAADGEARLNSRALRNVRRSMGDQAQIIDGPRWVIWAGYEGLMAPPTLALESTAEVGTVADPANYGKKLFVTDAATGEILFTEDQVHHVNISGNVSGMATELLGADICSNEIPMALPYADVRVQGGAAFFANAAGNYTITHGGTTAVTVESRLRGQWFEVFDQSAGGATPILSQVVTPPGPANFLHNQANTSEFQRSNVNTYLHANLCRDFVLSYEPAFPTIATQTFFDINTNLASTCNAFYNGSSINFYRAGGGCANTGFDTVVYHEYGHHLVAVTGSGQGAYGEGMSDCIAVIMTDDPVLGRGFQSNCGAGIRNANNTCQYSPTNCTENCGNEVHACGRLISGCVWSLRNELLNSEPGTYRDTLAALTLASIDLHTGTSINPQITIDFLTVDDDDGEIGNGTPHYDEIDAAFSAHNMPAPPLALVTFSYPNGRPATINPAGGSTMRVEVTPVGADPMPGTGVLHVDTGGGFTAFPMQEVTDNVYDAIFPSSTCGSEVKYYVSVETTDGDTAIDPPNAPAGFFTTLSASGAVTIFQDTFETNLGWTVENISLSDGPWGRGAPVGGGTRGDPPTDSNDAGSQCFLTDNVAGNSDVDGGPTRLVSPNIDMSGGAEFFLSYQRWFTNDDGDIDRLEVHISNDGGTNWTLVESVPGTSQGAWIARSFNVADVITPSASMRLRFSATDNPNDSVTEAGIDDVKVSAITCDSTRLTRVNVTQGTLLAGGLAEIIESDDAFLAVRSAPSSNSQRNLVSLRIRAITTNIGAATLDLLHEARLSQAGGTAQYRLRNWNTNKFVLVHSHSISAVEAVYSKTAIPAADYIRISDGRIDLDIRLYTIVNFDPDGFDSFTDQVRITTN